MREMGIYRQQSNAIWLVDHPGAIPERVTWVILF
jgi:hypothetical protein